MTIKTAFATVTASKDDAPDLPSMRVTTPVLTGRRPRHPAGTGHRSLPAQPGLLWSHNYHEIPIGSVTRLSRDGHDALHAQWRWLSGDSFVDRIKNAWQQRVIGASSIGFRPIEVKANQEGGFDVLKSELLEISLCAVGANQDAVRTLKSLGLLDEPRHTEPEPRFVFCLDDEDDEPIYRLSPNDLQEAIVEVAGTYIAGVVSREVRAAVNAARGRVD